MRKIIFAIGLIIVTSAAKAAEPSVLEEFFNAEGIKNKSSAYYGEMLEYYAGKPTIGEGLPKDVHVNFRKLNETHGSATYAVLLSKEKQTEDLYVFLVNENDTWKISAIRSLALPGLFYIALQEIEKKNPKTADEEWQYQNMILTIKSDSDLKNYLKTNVTQFNEVVALLSKGNKELSEKTARKLLINHVESNDGIIDLNIGGMIDNSVGYLFVPDGKVPPSMDPSSYIYIERITDGWYIYKTT